MWNNTGGFGQEFDGGNSNATEGGGGFMNSSTVGSPAPGDAKKRRAENIVPLTVSTIVSSVEDPLMYNEREVHMVAIVGIVKSVEVTSTKVSYVIDDHTGTIDVIKYADGESEEGPSDALAEGVYAKVFGPIRTHNGKKHILGFTIQQITDTNMITAHLLEIIHTNLKYKQLNGLADGAVNNNTTVLPNSTLMSNNSSGMGGGSSGLGSKEKDMVYAAIKSSNTDAGMSRNMIKSVLESKLTPSNIEKIIEDLSSDGIIYTTHDDDHFQVIDA